MKYNDYPLIEEDLVKVLNVEYANTFKVKDQQMCKVGLLEQKSKLNDLYTYISAQKENLIRLMRSEKRFVPKYDIDNHLKLLNSMGVMGVGKLNYSSRSCFGDYLKCEVEILKLLMYLILLDNLNYNKIFLTQILDEQLDIFAQIVSF